MEKLLHLIFNNKSANQSTVCSLLENKRPIGEEFEVKPGVKCVERNTGNQSTEQLLFIDGKNWKIGLDILGYIRSNGELEITARKPNSEPSDNSTRYFTIYTEQKS